MPKYMQKTVIEIKSLCKDFEIKQKSSGFFGGLSSALRPHHKHIKAVDNVSFSVNEGELFGLYRSEWRGKIHHHKNADGHFVSVRRFNKCSGI